MRYCVYSHDVKTTYVVIDPLTSLYPPPKSLVTNNGFLFLSMCFALGFKSHGAYHKPLKFIALRCLSSPPPPPPSGSNVVTFPSFPRFLLSEFRNHGAFARSLFLHMRRKKLIFQLSFMSYR